MLQHQKRCYMGEEQRLLITDWWERLQPLVRKFTRQTHLAGLDQDDIRQECFLLLEKALGSYREETGISFAYYYKVILRGWRANQNRKTQGREISWDEERVGCIEDERVDVAYEVERKMLIEKIEEILGGLADEEKQIIVAYYFEGKKLSDIAAQLGYSYKAVEYRKKRMMIKLRQRLEKSV